MKTSYFFVCYLVSNHVQVLASSTIHRLEFRGGDIFIDGALAEETQCNLENECEVVKSQNSVDIQTGIAEIVDIENVGTKENFKIIEIVKNKHDADVPKGPAESSPRGNEFDMLHKPIRDQHVLGSSGHEHGVNSSGKKQYSTNLKEGTVVHEGNNKNVAFVSTSKAGRKSQILDRKISQKLYNRFTDATVSLQNFANSQKPAVMHFAKELQERYGQSASTLSRMKTDSLEQLKQLKTVNLATVQHIVDDVAIRIKHLTSCSTVGVMNIIMNYSLGRESTLLLSNLSFSLLGASIGFFSYLYFVSVGYGLAIGTAAVALIRRGFHSDTQQVPLLTYLHTGMVVVWAARLIIFLLHREFINWPEWHEKVNEVHNRTTCKMKIYVWMTCGAFYSMMTYPCAKRMRNAIEQGKDATEWGAVGRTGLFLQTIGLLLETIADSQKGEFKRKTGNRNKWCNVGLWKTFSHPNYLGEAIFWSGVFLGGVGCNKTLKDWLISTTGLVFILTVLKGAIESLETKHMKNYSQNPDFIEFKKRRYKIQFKME